MYTSRITLSCVAPDLVVPPHPKPAGSYFGFVLTRYSEFFLLFSLQAQRLAHRPYISAQQSSTSYFDRETPCFIATLFATLFQFIIFGPLPFICNFCAVFPWHCHDLLQSTGPYHNIRSQRRCAHFWWKY